MGNGPHIQVPSGLDIRMAIIVRNPVMTLLYITDLPEEALRTGDVDQKGYGHFRQSHDDQTPEAMRQVIKRRWPDAVIYLLDRLGSGPASRWY